MSRELAGGPASSVTTRNRACELDSWPDDLCRVFCRSGVAVRGRVNTYVGRAARLQVASAARLKPFSLPLRPQPACSRSTPEFNWQRILEVRPCAGARRHSGTATRCISLGLRVRVLQWRRDKFSVAAAVYPVLTQARMPDNLKGPYAIQNPFQAESKPRNSSSNCLGGVF